MMTTVFLFLYFSLLHPLHLSVCDVFHNPQANTLEITQRIFADDLENALRNRYNIKIDIFKPEDPEMVKKIIGEYVQQNFSISVNSRPVQVNYLGYELDDEAVWVYLEVPKVRNFKSITVRNTLFFEMFTDQLNLINVKKEGEIRSMKLEPEQEQSSLSY